MLVALVARPALADDCAFNSKDLKPQFAKKLPSGFKLVSTKLEKKQHQLTQVLKTPDGFEVELWLGGCAHVGFSLAIKGPTLTSKTAGSELVAVSKRVLPTLPMESDATVSPSMLLKWVDETNIATLPTERPCGDATCKLELNAVEEKSPKKPSKKPDPKKPVEEKEPAGVLKLSYDFAL